MGCVPEALKKATSNINFIWLPCHAYLLFSSNISFKDSIKIISWENLQECAKY